MLAFIKRQRAPRRGTTVVRIEDGEPGLSARTIKRRLATIAGLYEYLIIRGDTGVTRNPVPRGLAMRRPGQRAVRGVPLIRAPRTLPRVINPDEVDALMAALRTPARPGHGRGDAAGRAAPLRGPRGLSLRPSTVAHIEHALREFGTWLADAPPAGRQLCRPRTPPHRALQGLARHQARAANRQAVEPVSIKNRLINLHCFFDRITDWGYPNPPQRPLVFAGTSPIVDKPLPRFLDDAAAAKLLPVVTGRPGPARPPDRRAVGPHGDAFE